MSIGRDASPDTGVAEYRPFDMAARVKEAYPHVNVLWIAGLFDQCFDLGYSYGQHGLENPIYTKPPAA